MAGNIFEQAYDRLQGEMPLRQFGSHESGKIAYGIDRTGRFLEIADELRVQEAVLPPVDFVTPDAEGDENNG